MTNQDHQRYTRAANEGTIRDSENPIFVFQSTANSVLMKIVKGELDVQRMIAFEMAARGLDKNGKWVGFKKAAEIWETDK